MSNAGFASLKYLKAQLLAEAFRASEKYDAVLTTIGLGIASQFDNFCQRPLARLADAVESFPADRCQFLLSRYPVEAITTIELKLTEAGGWEEKTVNDYIRTLDQQAGIVYLPDGADAGPYYAQLRFTYTGGYFIDTSDDGDAAVPTGATALPADLKFAWVLQCREVWNKIDKTGIGLVAGQGESVKIPALSDLKLIPQVEAILADYVRYNMV